MQEFIAKITFKKPTTATPLASIGKKTPTKLPVITPKASNKRKMAQSSGGAAASQVPEEPKKKNLKTILPIVEDIAGTP